MVAQSLLTTLAIVGAAVAAPQGHQGQWGDHSQSAGWAEGQSTWDGHDQNGWGHSGAPGYTHAMSEYSSGWESAPTSYGSDWTHYENTWTSYENTWTTYATTPTTTWETPAYSTPASTYVPPPPASTPVAPVTTSAYVPPPPPASSPPPPPPVYPTTPAVYTTPPPYPASSSVPMPSGSGVGVSSYYGPVQTGAANAATPLAGLLAGAFAVAMF